MSEVSRLLGWKTFRLAEKHAANQADNPKVREGVLQDTERLIAEGNIDPGKKTAMIRRSAARGVKFGEVCMDDVTPFDR